MAYTTINKSSSYFNTVLYTGNGSTLNVTGVGFKPDWVWLKSRNNTYYHNLYDAVRGFSSVYGRVLFTNDTLVEDANAGLTSFNTDGFSLGSEVGQNGNATTYVAWNWLGANTTVSNTSGSISSTVSANTTAGFSIVSYTGTGANATVGHGLGATPAMIIVKSRNATNGWYVVHNKSWGNDGNGLFLNNTSGIYNRVTDLGGTGITAWSSSTFSMTNGSGTFLCTNGTTYIAYCFATIKGYSAFGSYTGNGSTDGTFVYTGFKPAFMMIKNTTVADGWQLIDAKRNVTNGSNNSRLEANNANAESVNSTWTLVDLLSNGFKQRYTDNIMNASGSTYIYMAFAENPFVTSGGIPVTAR